MMLPDIDWKSHLTEEVQQSKEAIRRFWFDQEGAGRPLLSLRYENFADGISVKDTIENDELDLRLQLKYNDDVLRYRSDYVPRLSPYTGSTALASAFGAQIVYPDDNQPTCLPVILQAEDAYRIEKPDVMTADLGRVFEKTSYFLEQTGGQYPITIFDFQSPYDTVHLLWNHETFFTDLVLNPEPVLHLLDIVTDLTIEAGLKLRDMIPEFAAGHCPSVWIPGEAGITMPLDSMVNISPQMFRQFIAPSLEKISDAFGGLIVHSCGNWTHHREELKRIPGLKGVNFGAGEMMIEDVVEVFDAESGVKIIPHIGLNLPRTYRSNTEFIGHMLDVVPNHNDLFMLCWADDLNPNTPWKHEEYNDVRAFYNQFGYDW